MSDDDQTGHYVRVSAAARPGSLAGMSYLTQYSFGGRRERIAHGPCAAISLAQSRALTRGFLGDLARGLNPKAERDRAAEETRKTERRRKTTMAVVLEQWEGLHLSSRSPRYAAEALRSLRHGLGADVNKPIAGFGRKDAIALLDRLAQEGGPSAARHFATYGRAAWGWAVSRHMIESNPWEGLRLTPATSRDRVLSDDEVAAVWRATAGVGPFNLIVRTLILTAVRRDEAAGMSWEEISADGSTWTVPATRTKNGLAHDVPLVPALTDLLPAGGGEGLIFPSGRGGKVAGWSKAKERLDSRSGVTDWTLHDLRRTAATGMQRLGVRLEVVEAVLNHVSGSRAGIVGVYQRHQWQTEKREALEAWASHVMRLVAESK